MSITIKNGSATNTNEPMHEISSSVATSHPMASTIIHKPVQSVIQSTSSNGHIPIESSFNPINQSISTNDNDEYHKDSSSTQLNQYFVLRSSIDGSTLNAQPPVYRERSIEETEAAHDLLSLSQSLPPLPAPCVVTILHPDTNYNVNSPDVQEITPSRPSTKDYITYSCGRNTQHSSDRTELHVKNKKNVSTQFDADMLPDDSSSSGEFS